MGIVNIDREYSEDDFQSLITYKLFNQHVRPLLLEKNPKLVMYKMVSVIGAKWREFIELREAKEKSEKKKPKKQAVTPDTDTETEDCTEVVQPKSCGSQSSSQSTKSEIETGKIERVILIKRLSLFTF